MSHFRNLRPRFSVASSDSPKRYSPRLLTLSCTCSYCTSSSVSMPAKSIPGKCSRVMCRGLLLSHGLEPASKYVISCSAQLNQLTHASGHLPGSLIVSHTELPKPPVLSKRLLSNCARKSFCNLLKTHSHTVFRGRQVRTWLKHLIHSSMNTWDPERVHFSLTLVNTVFNIV